MGSGPTIRGFESLRSSQEKLKRELALAFCFSCERNGIIYPSAPAIFIDDFANNIDRVRAWLAWRWLWQVGAEQHSLPAHSV